MSTTKPTPAKNQWNAAVEDKLIRARQIGRPVTAAQAASAVEREQPGLRQKMIDEANS